MIQNFENKSISAEPSQWQRRHEELTRRAASIYAEAAAISAELAELWRTAPADEYSHRARFTRPLQALLPVPGSLVARWLAAADELSLAPDSDVIQRPVMAEPTP